MKIEVSIWKGHGDQTILIAKKTVNGKKQALEFEKEIVPDIPMHEKVKEGWKVFRSY